MRLLLVFFIGFACSKNTLKQNFSDSKVSHGDSVRSDDTTIKEQVRVSKVGYKFREVKQSSITLYPVLSNKLYIKKQKLPIPPKSFDLKNDFFYFKFKDYPQFMEEWNWKIGDKITWISYNSGEVKEYIFNEESTFMISYQSYNLYMAPDGNPHNEAEGIFIILENDQGREKSGRFIGGAAFFGEKNKSPFQPGKVISPKWQQTTNYPELTLKDFKSYEEEAKRKIYTKFSYDLSLFDNIEIVKPFFSYEMSEIYPHSCNCLYGIYFKLDNSFYAIRELGMEPDYSANPTMSLGVGKFIKNSNAVFVYEEEGMHSCGGLVIVYENRVEKIRLDCDSGGC